MPDIYSSFVKDWTAKGATLPASQGIKQSFPNHLPSSEEH
jgi:hypothetical protein